jgi:outer membrane protein OmpA-like peptidoglycan-associated protein
MSAQRRDAAESAERIWQIYADEIGIPDAPPAGATESLPRESEGLKHAARPVRRVARHVVQPLAAIAIVMVAAIVGVALWPGSPKSPDTADRTRPPAAKPAAATVGEADRIAQPPAPATQAGGAFQAPAPSAPTPSDIVHPLEPKLPVAPSTAAVRPDTTQASAARPVETRQASIKFEFDSDHINDESRRLLDKLVVTMKANPDWRVRIEGHTDAHGTPDYNRALSERRADVVRAYLQSAGIARARLSVAAFGATRPVAPHDAPGNALNRRVELHRQ